MAFFCFSGKFDVPSSHLLDGLKGVAVSDWKLVTCLFSSSVRVLPGLLWQTPPPDSELLQDRRLAAWMGFPFGSRPSASPWQRPSISMSFWVEDCARMWGMERGSGEDSLWDSCSFFMWWTTEAALKACCWKCTQRNKLIRTIVCHNQLYIISSDEPL